MTQRIVNSHTTQKLLQFEKHLLIQIRLDDMKYNIIECVWGTNQFAKPLLNTNMNFYDSSDNP